MWAFLSVNHKFKGGYGFLLLTEHPRGGAVDVLCMQKAIDVLHFIFNFSKACSCHSFIHVTSACPEGASPSGKITADATSVVGASPG